MLEGASRPSWHLEATLMITRSSNALLALSLSFGGSLVRAEGPASPFENIVSDPLAKVVQTIELRLAGLEATMMAFAGSFPAVGICPLAVPVVAAFCAGAPLPFVQPVTAAQRATPRIARNKGVR